MVSKSKTTLDATDTSQTPISSSVNIVESLGTRAAGGVEFKWGATLALSAELC